MRPDIATLLQGLQGDSSVLANLLANMGASAPQAPDVQQPQQLPQMTAPQGPSFDLSAAPALYMPQMPSSNPIAREQVTATATGGAGAGDSVAGQIAAGDHAGIINSLVGTESGGNWKAQNSEGYSGRLQFGSARLSEAAKALGLDGITADQFKADPALQQKVEAWHFNDIDQQAARRGLDKYIGSTINGVRVTMPAIEAMAHLGGIGGATRFLESGGAYDPADSNGTNLSDYARIHGGAQPAGDTPMATKQVANSPASHIVSFLQDAFGVKGGAGDTAVNGGGGQDTLAPVTATATATGGVGAGAKASGMAEWLDNVFKAKPISGPAGGPLPPTQPALQPRNAPSGNPISLLADSVGAAPAVAASLGAGTDAATSALGLAGSSVLDFIKSLGPQAESAQPQATTSGISATGSATGPVPGTQTTTSQMNAPAFQNDSDLAALMPDASPEARKKARNALTWQMIGTGLGQMSHGDRVDLSGVINEHVRRQEVAQQRVAEIAMERQRRFERAQTHGWDQEAQAADQAFVQAQNQAEADAKAAEEAAKAAAANAAAVASQNAYAAALDPINPEAAATVRSLPPAEAAAYGQNTLETYNTQVGTATNQATSQAAADAKTVAERKATASAMLQPALRLAMDPTVPKEQRDAALSHVAALVPITRDGSADPNDVTRNLPSMDKKAALVNNTFTASGEGANPRVAVKLQQEDAAKIDEQIAVMAPMIGKIKAITSALSKGVETNALAPLKNQLAGYAYAAGLLTPGQADDYTATQLIDSLAGGLIQAQHVTGSGPFTQTDYTSFAGSVPGLSNPTEQNKLLAQQFERTYETMSAKKNAYRKYITENPDGVEFEASWQAAQTSGDQPSPFYVLTDDPASMDTLLKATSKGFAKTGDVVFVQNADGTTDMAKNFVIDENTPDSVQRAASEVADGTFVIVRSKGTPPQLVPMSPEFRAMLTDGGN